MLEGTKPSPDVVIVGAGPVGLLVAAHLSSLFKNNSIDKKIHIIEKYQEYQRIHTLQVNEESIIHDRIDPELQKILKGFVGKTRTVDIEQNLKAFNEQHGVTFEYKTVEDGEKLVEAYPQTPYFIGADGAHSIIRQKMFENDLDIKKDLQYILQVTYETQGTTEPLNFWQKGYQFLQTNHLVNEFVKPGENTSSVSLQIILSNEEYEVLEPFAKAKDKISIDDPRIPQSVKETIDTWMAARKEACADNLTEAGAKISAVKLSVYASKESVKQTQFQNNKQNWILCGDSLFGVPYFRSLNNGWKCALELADCLFMEMQGLEYEDHVKLSSSSISSSSLSLARPTEPLLRYQAFAKNLANYENVIARLNAVKIQMADKTIGSSRLSYQMSTQKIEKMSTSSAPISTSIFNFVMTPINFISGLFKQSNLDTHTKEENSDEEIISSFPYYVAKKENTLVFSTFNINPKTSQKEEKPSVTDEKEYYPNILGYYQQ